MNFGGKFAIIALMLGGVASALGACQSLAGIHDRSYDPDASVPPSQACQSYCTLAQSVCNTDAVSLYESPATCLSVCALLEVPDEDAGIEFVPNSITCRTRKLVTAMQTAGEPDQLPSLCAAAGPGGNGECGSNCESYCKLYAAACEATLPFSTTPADPQTCQQECEGLPSTTTFSSVDNYQGDTVQCRLVHTSAATRSPTVHCVHAQMQNQSQATMPGPCINPKDSPANSCEDFCKLELSVCQGHDATYENLAQCLAVCGALDVGQAGDISENTVGCRMYHSYNALVSTTHCPHTGPGGDGHCGTLTSDGIPGNCLSYCGLLKTACSSATHATLALEDSFEGTFSDDAACQSDCALLQGSELDAPYSVNPLPKGNDFQCRLLHVSRALTTPAKECGAALGGAPCN